MCESIYKSEKKLKNFDIQAVYDLTFRNEEKDRK